MSSPDRRSRIRPGRPVTPFITAALVLLVWWVVARNSGSGWVQALGDCVFGLLLIGLFGPAITVARTKVEIKQVPADSAAGLPTLLSITANRRTRVLPRIPTGSESFIGPGPHGSDEEVIALPQMRGIYTSLVVELSTAAPFGLQWWSRRIDFPLEISLHVAPRLGTPVRLPRWIDDCSGVSGAPAPSDGGDARGVREYRPGDRRRRVHWGATSHAGRLMIRETEEPSVDPITLRVALPGDADAAERLAEAALGTIVSLLDKGMRVVLVTDETVGEVTGPVEDRRAAGRRLARAITSPGPSGVELIP